MLNEDTDPSIRPIKKKIMAMVQIKASMLKEIQNNRNIMNSPPQSFYSTAFEKDVFILLIILIFT